MTSGLKAFYKALYSYFGPQYWWPADSAFEVMVGAVLTQNTNWANVEKARQLLNWAPQVSLQQGISHMIEWYNAERDWASQVITG